MGRGEALTDANAQIETSANVNASPLQRMKTHKNLYAQITEFHNLYRAFQKASRGKRSHVDVAAFEYDVEKNLLALRDELRAQTYRPGGYYHFRIHDPKPRVISAAPFRDRVVHHALCNVIEPLFEKRFVDDSYACRKKKGTHAALNQATRYARKYQYVLKVDVEHFFPTIDHEILRGQFRRVIADKPTLALMDAILDGGAQVPHEYFPPHLFPNDDLFALLRPRGLPIGNLTSQFWANVYLNPLDHYIKRELKGGGYVRYVDDLLLFDDDKTKLHEWRHALTAFAARLRLTLHEKQAVVFPVRAGIPFLGFRVYPDHRRLKRRNGVAFQRKLQWLCEQLAKGEIEMAQFNASKNGWLAHAKHGDTYGLRRALVSQVVIPRRGEAFSVAFANRQVSAHENASPLPRAQ